MNDQPGQSPWSPSASGSAVPGMDAPTTASAPVGGGAPLPGPKKMNWLMIVVAVNAVIVLIGAVVIVVLLTSQGDDGSDVAIFDDGPSTSSDRDADTSRGADDDGSGTEQEDGPVELGPGDTKPVSTGARVTTLVPAPTAPQVTLAPVTSPPTLPPAPTLSPSPALPGPAEAVDQARTTLTDFMAADTRGDVDAAMAYLAPPVEKWVDLRDADAARLRADIGDRKSAAVQLSLIEEPSLAFGPEPTADGGWLVKVNYRLHAEGDYVSEDGSIKCVDNDQTFQDTLVASPGGMPRISSHEQTDTSNYC